MSRSEAMCKKRLWATLGLTLVTAGCTPDVVGRIDGLKVADVLNRREIQETVAKASGLGADLAGAAAAVLGILLWYKAQKGQAWVSILKDLFLWVPVCASVLAGSRTGHGLERWLFEAGQWLGRDFSVGESAVPQVFFGV